MAAKIPPFIPFSESSLFSEASLAELKKHQSSPIASDFLLISETKRTDVSNPPDSSPVLPNANEVVAKRIHIDKETGAVTLEPSQVTAIAMSAYKGTKHYGCAEIQALHWVLAPSSEGLVYIWGLLSSEQRQLVRDELARIKKELD